MLLAACLASCRTAFRRDIIADAIKHMPALGKHLRGLLFWIPVLLIIPLSMWVADSVTAKSTSAIHETAVSYQFLDDRDPEICGQLRALKVRDNANSSMQDVVCILPGAGPPQNEFKTPTNPKYSVTLTRDLCAYWTSIAQLVAHPPQDRTGVLTVAFQNIQVFPPYCIFGSTDIAEHVAVVRRSDRNHTTVRLANFTEAGA